MYDDTDEQVEENGEQIFHSISVECGKINLDVSICV